MLLYGSVIVVQSKTIVHAVLMNSIGNKTWKAHDVCFSEQGCVTCVCVLGLMSHTLKKKCEERECAET